MADPQEDSNMDYIVMTPTKKGKATHIKIERKKRLTFEDQKVAHVGGGDHKGLVINNQTTDEDDDLGKPQLQLGFACFLVDQKTGDHLVETRKLKFWYVEGTEYLDQVTRAYDFFKELIRPEDFPRDYVGFITKCMKQMQGPGYTQIRRVELSMQQLDQSEAPLSPEVKMETTVNSEQEIQQTVVYENNLPPPPPPEPEEEKIEEVIQATTEDKIEAVIQATTEEKIEEVIQATTEEKIEEVIQATTEEKIEAVKRTTTEEKIEEVKQATTEEKIKEVKQATTEVKIEEVKQATTEEKIEAVKRTTTEEKIEEVKQATTEEKIEAVKRTTTEEKIEEIIQATTEEKIEAVKRTTTEEKIEEVKRTTTEVECPLPDIIDEEERPLPDVVEEEIQTFYSQDDDLPPPSFLVEEVVNGADIDEDLPPPVGVVEEAISDIDIDEDLPPPIDFVEEMISDIDIDEDLPPPVGVVEEVISDIDFDEEVISDADIDEDRFSAPIIVGMTVDGLPKIDNRPKDEILREKMLHILESAYPNILAVEDICRITAADEVMVREQLKELNVRNLVTEMEQGGFMRHVLDEKSEVQLVKQMPTIAANQQPTIAIITAMYYEKLAVDAMMENKTTYMKYKTEGESNVYTIGFIGEHKVVSTKLPAIGHARFAQISSGNTTTRLLGTFQNIEHVFVVGVAGGVPYYTDYYKHVRLGDVVISRGEDRNVIYYYCEKILKNKSGDLQYIHKTFAPKDNCLQQTARKIVETSECNPGSKPWEIYVEEGQKFLQGQEVHFMRPSSNTDRLYMNIGEDNVIEVEHPQPPEEIVSTFDPDKPRVHFGVLGSGRPVVKSDATRLDFAGKYNIKAFDTEFDQVLESIEGNRKDSFMFIRGVSDYTDGSKNKEWQPYAALAAAAFMKTIIKALSNPLVEDL